MGSAEGVRGRRDGLAWRARARVPCATPGPPTNSSTAARSSTGARCRWVKGDDLAAIRRSIRFTYRSYRVVAPLPDMAQLDTMNPEPAPPAERAASRTGPATAPRPA